MTILALLVSLVLSPCSMGTDIPPTVCYSTNDETLESGIAAIYF